MKATDVVIVGGGIAGGSLATALAAAGFDVLVLERQVEYRDHVRGEIVWPWGVRAARALGLEHVLLEAGGQVVDSFDIYDEGAQEPLRLDVGEAVPAIDGSLNIRHPEACSALTRAATSAGADVRKGARDVRATLGKHPGVRWTDAGGVARETSCRLVVGADGRRSSVRSRAGVGLEVDPPAHLVAGMLVGAVPRMNATVNVMAREDDLIFYSFPQHDGCARLYFCFPNGQPSRFAGVDGWKRFLATSTLRCLDGVADWANAERAGPCATFPGEDSRVESPIAEGVVLIGDAAGYENPLQGQGLSMALQDAHDVAACMLSANGARLDLTDYAHHRATRKRLADLGTMLEVWTNEGCVAQDPAERAARVEHVEADELLAALELCFMTGFDALPQDLTHADVADRLAAYSPRKS